jgi:hypothetical protein
MFDLAMFNDYETVEDYSQRLSGMAAHHTTLSEEVKDNEIIMKMLRSLSPRSKQINITIKTLLNVSTTSVADLTGRLKEADEVFEEALTPLQHDRKLYLTKDKWEAWMKKREGENHSDSSARCGDRHKGSRRGRDYGCGGSSSSGLSNKPTSDEC